MLGNTTEQKVLHFGTKDIMAKFLQDEQCYIAQNQ